MKIFLTLLCLLSFIVTNAQFEQGKIFLKNGSTRTGLIKERNYGGIKFKEKEGSDVEIYDHTTIDGYDITENGLVKYAYKKTENGLPQIMQVVRVGKINLFSIKVSKRDITTGIRVNYSFLYFVEKDNILTRIGKKLSQSNLELLDDCPDLIKKIKKKEFKKNEIYKIVNFYNMNCG